LVPIVSERAVQPGAFAKVASYVNSDEYGESFESSLAVSAFQHSFVGDLYTFGLDGTARESLVNILKLITEKVVGLFDKQPVLTCLDETKAFLLIDTQFLLTVSDESSGSVGDIWVVASRAFSITGYGSEADIQASRDILSVVLDGLNQRLPNIRWHYTSGGSRCKRSIPFEKPKLTYDDFYPWITEGLTAYIERFAASDDAVLVLLGEPGTGKTSFIRQMIWRTGWNCAVTYDEQLLRTDSLFVDFMTNDEEELLVVEDADLFLTSRERDRNDMMARFLNVSDGLFKTSKVKKLVFTANLTQPQQIDNALLREGRCFDCAVFLPFELSRGHSCDRESRSRATKGGTRLHSCPAIRDQKASYLPRLWHSVSGLDGH
jgi:ATPase family associated with various cellular activities (AAA)